MTLRLSVLFASFLLLAGCPEPGDDDDATLADDDDVSPDDDDNTSDDDDSAGDDDDSGADDDDDDSASADADGDGFPASEDCDDSDPATFPGAVEACDGVDNDCDDLVPADEADSDGDGSAPCAGDCDDDDAGTHPEAAEACDGADNNCDGVVPLDELDVDADGIAACDGDCDDADDSVAPDLPEACDGFDNDCADGVPADEADADGDGVRVCAGDCDDADADTFPGAVEDCDDVSDLDCDGDPTLGATDGDTWYGDADGDGFGGTDLTTVACEQPDGYTDLASATDCDDLDATTFPGAPELCDGADNDCDTAVPTDEADGDGDGVAACAGDCDDADDTSAPGLPERCDGRDNDCDPAVPADETDDDGDGTAECEGDCDDTDSSTDGVDDDGDGVSDCDGDCDDGDSGVHPAASEDCDDTTDLNCDGDTTLGAADGDTWYGDADGDSYGGTDLTVVACEQPDGYTDAASATDCDDLDPATYPGAPEACDGADNDCDTTVPADELDGDGDGAAECEGDCAPADSAIGPSADEDCDDTTDLDCDGDPTAGATDTSTFYGDADGDSYGGTSFTIEACVQPAGYSATDDDCDDLDAAINPGAAEVECSGVDEDCDTVTEGDFDDSDGDGQTGCEGDCDDGEDTVYLGAPELCDGIDNDCDGDADDGSPGSGPDCPGVDCDDILDQDNSAADDIYWIDPGSTGTPFEIFCDMTNDGGGWTLAANLDDTDDPFFGGHSAPFYDTEWVSAWEGTGTLNPDEIATFDDDLTVSAKYRTWSEMTVSDVRIAYKNDGAYFLGEDLDVQDTLSAIFSDVPAVGTCSSDFASVTETRLGGGWTSPMGLNCSDPNEAWYDAHPGAENARIGALDAVNPCCVMVAWAGGMGDRGYSTSIYEKTWGNYSSGVITDDNILIFVR